VDIILQVRNNTLLRNWADREKGQGKPPVPHSLWLPARSLNPFFSACFPVLHLVVQEPAIETRQKNPSIAVAASGAVLTAWGEAISHSKGGELRAQLTGEHGDKIDWTLDAQITIPNFSFPAAAAIGDDDFLLLW